MASSVLVTSLGSASLFRRAAELAPRQVCIAIERAFRVYVVFGVYRGSASLFPRAAE